MTQTRMTQTRARLLLPALYFWMLLFGAARAAAADGSDAAELDRIFRRSTLQIATPDARLHTFKIWVADDEQRRSRGLMFVKHLAAEDGMLFVYPQPQPIAIWMKNTYISLDILFVDADGKVARVFENAKPLSLASMESGSPALGVVELAAGSAARLKIAAGAQVIHPVFSASKSKP